MARCKRSYWCDMFLRGCSPITCVKYKCAVACFQLHFFNFRFDNWQNISSYDRNLFPVLSFP